MLVATLVTLATDLLVSRLPLRQIEERQDDLEGLLGVLEEVWV